MGIRLQNRVLKQSLLFSVAFVLLGCQRPVPTVTSNAGTPSVQPRAAPFFSFAAMRDSHYFPDGKSVLVNLEMDGPARAVRIDLDSGQQTPVVELADGDIRAARPFPRDDRVLYFAPASSGVTRHLWVGHGDDDPLDLTPSAQGEVRFLGWRKNGDSFWIVVNDDVSRTWRLVQIASKGYPRRVLLEGTPAQGVVAISSDGRWVALEKPGVLRNSQLLLQDMSRPDDAPLPLTERENYLPQRAAAFAADGRELYFASSKNGEYESLWAASIPEGQVREVVVGVGDIHQIELSPDGRYMGLIASQNGASRPIIYETQTMQPVSNPTPPLGQTTALRFSPQSTAVVFLHTSDTSPADLFLLELRQSQLRRITDNLNPKLAREQLASGEHVRYTNPEGISIPMILYRPQNASVDNPVPAMLWTKGGPGTLQGHTYDPLLQLKIARGIAVVKVNGRGAVGYGKGFAGLDSPANGNLHLRDCSGARNYLKELGWVDVSRTAIYGADYASAYKEMDIKNRPRTEEKRSLNEVQWAEKYLAKLERRLLGKGGNQDQQWRTITQNGFQVRAPTRFKLGSRGVEYARQRGDLAVELTINPADSFLIYRQRSRTPLEHDSIVELAAQVYPGAYLEGGIRTERVRHITLGTEKAIELTGRWTSENWGEGPMIAIGVQCGEYFFLVLAAINGPWPPAYDEMLRSFRCFSD